MGERLFIFLQRRGASKIAVPLLQSITTEPHDLKKVKHAAAATRVRPAPPIYFRPSSEAQFRPAAPSNGAAHEARWPANGTDLEMAQLLPPWLAAVHIVLPASTSGHEALSTSVRSSRC